MDGQTGERADTVKNRTGQASQRRSNRPDFQERLEPASPIKLTPKRRYKVLLNRFQNGTIVDFQAGEDLKNNDLYIVDPETRKIRKPRDCDEWLTCQLVYVNDVYPRNDNVIFENEWCRCWIGYLVI